MYLFNQWMFCRWMNIEMNKIHEFNGKFLSPLGSCQVSAETYFNTVFGCAVSFWNFLQCNIQQTTQVCRCGLRTSLKVTRDAEIWTYNLLLNVSKLLHTELPLPVILTISPVLCKVIHASSEFRSSAGSSMVLGFGKPGCFIWQYTRKGEIGLWTVFGISRCCTVQLLLRCGQNRIGKNRMWSEVGK